MVKIVQINRENAGFFAGLDPLSVLERERKPMVPQMVLGAAVSAGSDGSDGAGGAPADSSDIPVGLMVAGVYQTALVIFWLYVDPRYRGQGIGELLLEDVFSAADSAGKKSVAALLGNEYGRDFVCPYEREYLSYQGFNREMTIAGGKRTVLVADLTEDDEPIDVWDFDELLEQVRSDEERELTDEDLVISARDIVSSGRLTLSEKEKAMLMPNVVPISDLPLPKLYETLKKCLKAHPYAFDGDITEHPVTWFEPRLSCCYMSGDEVTGLFLVHRENDRFWAEYAADFSSAASEHIYKMVKYAADIFAKTASAGQTVVIRRYNADIRALTERFFGDGKK